MSVTCLLRIGKDADDARRQDGGGRSGPWHLTRHDRANQRGEKTSRNPIASIFAWTLERVCAETVESEKMTKDFAILTRPDHPWLGTEEFLDAIDAGLKRSVA